MKLHFIDRDESVVSALRDAFGPFPEVVIRHGDVLEVACNTVVSPANSFGFMDGGVDQTYANYFGLRVQSRVHDAIARRPEGHLPVGASLVIRTDDTRIPFLIVAPTMLAPETIDRSNCYRAMRAILRVAAADEEVGRAVYCPGLGTGVGGVPPIEAAQEMAQAYADWKRSA